MLALAPCTVAAWVSSIRAGWKTLLPLILENSGKLLQLDYWRIQQSGGLQITKSSPLFIFHVYIPQHHIAKLSSHHRTPYFIILTA